MEIDKIKVLNVTYRTSATGEILPSLIVESDDDSFDCILLSSIDDMVTKKIGIGSIFKVSDDDKVDVFKESTDFGVFPEKCHACNSDIEKGFCKYILCGAKPRTPIIKLIKLATENSFKIDKILDYLNYYPLGNGKVSIGDLGTFNQVYGIIKHRDTYSRKEQWGKNEDGFEIDMQLSKFLNNGKMYVKDFWDIASLPTINSEEDKEQLCKLHPVYFENQYKVVPDHIYKVASNNADFIKFLTIFLTKNGIKEWL